MYVVVAGFKGGTGKTTSSINIAAYLSRLGKTLLADGDVNRSACGWYERGGRKLPFAVMNEKAAAMNGRNFEHVVIDTAARPDSDDLKELAQGCDFLILPTSPEAMALDALLKTAKALEKIRTEAPVNREFQAPQRVLITMARPNNRDASQAREALMNSGIPVFHSSIRLALAFQRASLNGCLVQDVADPRAKDAWGDYEAVGQEMLAIMGQEGVK